MTDCPLRRLTLVTIYFVRHGEVHNPEGIIYGRLPGFGLSETGREQIQQAGGALKPYTPFHALYASPLQRAQESAKILSNDLGIPIITEDLLMETGIGGYQGKSFEALPKPYITEKAVHEGIESAEAIRARIFMWTARMEEERAGQRIIAVSHRDPLIVAFLHWMNRGLEDLPGFDLKTGGVYEVQLEGRAGRVKQLV